LLLIVNSVERLLVSSKSRIGAQAPKLQTARIMKEWLKHKHGYLNIDEKNLYFTKTGNWSEIADLKEQNSTEFKTADQNSKIKLILLLGIIDAVSVWQLFSKDRIGGFNLLLFMSPIVSFYLVCNYLNMVPPLLFLKTRFKKSNLKTTLLPSTFWIMMGQRQRIS
jgi:hypothetical protein